MKNKLGKFYVSIKTSENLLTILIYNLNDRQSSTQSIA